MRPLNLPTIEMAREVCRTVCAEFGLDARILPTTEVVTRGSSAYERPCFLLSFEDAPESAHARAVALAWEIRSRTLHRI